MKFKDHKLANGQKILSPCKTKNNENVRTKVISLFVKLLLLMAHNVHKRSCNFPGIFHSTSPDFFTSAFFRDTQHETIGKGPILEIKLFVKKCSKVHNFMKIYK